LATDKNNGVQLTSGEAFESRDHYADKYQNQIVICSASLLGRSENFITMFGTLFFDNSIIFYSDGEWDGSVLEAAGDCANLAAWGLTWKRDDICTIIINAESIMQGHRPETYLAWMQSLDSIDE
jgi:hypothetical protein